MSKSLAIRAARILQALKDKNRDSLEISELAALDLAIESLAPEDELLPAGEYDHETGAVWHVWRQASAVTDEMVERANSMRESDEVIVCTDDVHALVVHPSTARKPATPAPAVEREAEWMRYWKGSPPERGWHIRERGCVRPGPILAYLGDGIAEEQVDALIEAHNAALAPRAEAVEPLNEPFGSSEQLREPAPAPAVEAVTDACLRTLRETAALPDNAGWIASVTPQDARAILAALALAVHPPAAAAPPRPSEQQADFPECSGDPRDCPENEGYGCCKNAAPADEAGKEKA